MTMDDGSGAQCCAGGVPRTSPAEARTVLAASGSAEHHPAEVLVAAGSFEMGDSSGDANPGDGELPIRRVDVAAFGIDSTSVTNAAFTEFVAATGYVTDAEDLGISPVFHLAVRADDRDVLGAATGTPWWAVVRGADWRHPAGPLSSLDGLDEHPVVQVTWRDAAAYAAWCGRRLPSEVEWEYASRGGLDGAKYPWGDQEVDEGGWRANIWQGRFPTVNTCDDGYLTTAPVHTFEPNGYGLWQTVGNVWEWCHDTWLPDADQADPEALRVMRGGSYLCHISYCNRYRNSARTSTTADSASGNVGFRTTRSL